MDDRGTTHRIAATRTDADVLSSYLGDATFLANGFAMDADAGRFTLDVRRIWHERGRPGWALLLVPVIRYPTIASRLIVTDVVSFRKETWSRRSASGPHGEYLILAVDSEADDTLGIHADGMAIRLTLRPASRLIIEDVPGTDIDAVFTDVGRRTRFRFMDELERLRLNGDG